MKDDSTISRPTAKNHVSRRTAMTQFAVGTAGAVAAGNLAVAQEGSSKELKSPFKHSICQWCFNGKLSMEELCANAARIGYHSIEIIGPDLWPIAKKHGLTCAMAWGQRSIPNGLNRRENHEQCQAELRENIVLAGEAGLPNVICFSGNRNGQDDEEGIEICAEGLKPVLGLAEEHKVNICMELLNSKVNHKDYQFDHIEWGVELTKKLGSERFGILYDIYHAQVMEGDIIRNIRTYHEYIKHYHTAGNPGRNEIDDTQELNYAAIMRAIGETGYTGYVGQEYVPVHDPVAGLEEAYEICNVAPA